MTTATPPAGWYDDPETAGKLRWWDGSDWTERRADAPPVTTAAPTSGPEPAQHDAPEAPSRAVRPPDAAAPAGGFASPAHGLTPDRSGAASGHSEDDDTGEWRVADVERAEVRPIADQPQADASVASSASRGPIEADSDVLVWGTPPVRDDRMSELASPWSRLAAYLLDTALSFVAFIVLGVASALLGILPDGLAAVVGFVLTIGTWALLFVLYVMGTGRLGQSYGKHLMGISVVSTRTGRPIGSPAAFGRGIVQTIGIYVFFLGVLWILWDPQRQGWHDKAVGSVVVEDPATTRMDPLAFLRAIFATR